MKILSLPSVQPKYNRVLPRFRRSAAFQQLFILAAPFGARCLAVYDEFLNKIHPCKGRGILRLVSYFIFRNFSYFIFRLYLTNARVFRLLLQPAQQRLYLYRPPLFAPARGACTQIYSCLCSMLHYRPSWQRLRRHRPLSAAPRSAASAASTSAAARAACGSVGRTSPAAVQLRPPTQAQLDPSHRDHAQLAWRSPAPGLQQSSSLW